MKETKHKLIDPDDLTRQRTITIRGDGVVVAIKEKERREEGIRGGE